MAEERKTNKDAVKDYHKKLVNLAIIRVPSADKEGNELNYKDSVVQYLCERYGEKKEGTPEKSMNEYLLDLIEQDMNEWYESQGRTDRITFARGVKDLK